jgi:NADH-quinone oxidoreductase subunit G
MPSSFSGRSWELNYIQSVDVLDAISSNIRIAVASNMVRRIVPSLDEFYDEWITNKIRFVYDSFINQRLYYPKLKLYSKFIVITWKLAIFLFLDLLYNKSKNFIEIYCNSFLSLELSLTLKSFFNSFGCSNFNYLQDNNNIWF